jgi:glycosyltransferase involved in cell wall biosynthesis
MEQAVKVMQKRSAKAPLVSVVMSVFNGEKYLHEAINSILQQTFTDFEFIIVDDGSTDSTCRIIQSYDDPRIILISRANKGLVASLNEAILSAKGIYIARQDADDVSHLARLQAEVFFLRNNRD